MAARGAPARIHDHYKQLFESFPVTLVSLPENSSPASSRKVLTENASADCLLLLDDDFILTPASNKLFHTIENSNFDIVGGVWLQSKPSCYSELMSETEARGIKNQPLPDTVELSSIGFSYSFSQLTEQRFVVKTPVYFDFPGGPVVTLDDVMPSLIARRSIFETCNFDSRFGYFFEWFDFYIQCKNEGISCAADAGAYFYHIPEKYANATSAQNCPREIDRQRFIEKWRIHPRFSDEVQRSISGSLAARVVKQPRLPDPPLLKW